MKIAGIIAEYDPFHKGHAHHIAATRAAGATHIVAIISGSFTQRGEPASMTKWQRTEMALSGGVDLVIELPLPWAMAPAERFAEGGVSLLAALGCVDTLSFGSERGDITALEELAETIDSPEHRRLLLHYLGNGLSYAAARQAAVQEQLGDEAAALLSGANNTLGVEYIRAIRRLHASLSLFTIPRLGAAHNAGAVAETASASHLRRLIREGKAEEAFCYMPEAAAAIAQKALVANYSPADAGRLHSAVLAKLRSMSTEELAALPYLSEGLENRLAKAIATTGNLPELLEAVGTRRYPTARLRRIVWAALLGLPAHLPYRLPPYIRLLGLNDRGKEILATAQPALPILSAARQVNTLSKEAQALFRLECRASDLHALTLPTPLPCGTDMTTKMVRG